MAKDQTVRIRPAALAADHDVYTAVQSFGNYQPANPAYSLEKLGAALTAMQTAQKDEVNAQNALDAARDAATAAEWESHNVALGVKDQVVAQYGKDSDQVQALGLKKKSERKSPARKGKPA